MLLCFCGEPRFFIRLIPGSSCLRLLDCPHASPGIQFANSLFMPDVPISAAARNPRRRQQQKRGLGIVFALLLGAGGLWLWIGEQRSIGASASATSESTLPLETFVVNLKGSGQRGYLRIGITLGLARSLPRTPEAVPTAAVRDTILAVLATAQADELLQVDGKRQLKDDLLKALQERVPQIAVVNVYFTEFLVQM